MKKTQGSIKRKRMFEDFLRDYDLRRILKRIRKERKKANENYDEKEFEEILDQFLLLKKRIEIFHKKLGFKRMFDTAEIHAIDGYIIDSLNHEIIERDRKITDLLATCFGEMDMCKVFDLYDEDVNGEGDEWGVSLTLRPYRTMNRISFPIAIGLHPGASKRDVLDFVEKRWSEIENNLRRDVPYNKPVRMKKRKYPQELLDFIWLNKSYTDMEIKRRLDEQFPNNGLAYYEINKLLHLEMDRRNYGK